MARLVHVFVRVFKDINSLETNYSGKMSLQSYSRETIRLCQLFSRRVAMLMTHIPYSLN